MAFLALLNDAMMVFPLPSWAAASVIVVPEGGAATDRAPSADARPDALAVNDFVQVARFRLFRR